MGCIHHRGVLFEGKLQIDCDAHRSWHLQNHWASLFHRAILLIVVGLGALLLLVAKVLEIVAYFSLPEEIPSKEVPVAF